MPETFRTQRRVEFRDTDAAGIVHFSVFFAYMEQAEHEFLRHLGLSVVQEVDGREISWPRVRAECNYRRPARFEDLLEVAVRVAKLGAKSVTYAFEFRCGEQILADGAIVAACCEIEHRQLKGAVTIPLLFRERLAPFVQADPT